MMNVPVFFNFHVLPFFSPTFFYICDLWFEDEVGVRLQYAVKSFSAVMTFDKQLATGKIFRYTYFNKLLQY